MVLADKSLPRARMQYTEVKNMDRRNIFGVLAFIFISWATIACDDQSNSSKEKTPGEVLAGTEMNQAGTMIAGTSIAGQIVAGTTVASEIAGEVQVGQEPPQIPDILPQEGDGIEGATNLGQERPSSLRVGYVDEDTEVFEGQDVACRLGSIRLENTKVTACLQGESSLTQFKRKGFNLVDFMSWDYLGTDGLSELIVAPGFGELTPQEVKIMSSGGEDRPAIVQVRAITAGSRILTSYLPSYVPRLMNVVNEYHLYADREELEVHTWVEVGDRAISLQMSDFVIWADPTRLFYPNQNGERIPPNVPYLGGHLPKLSYIWRVADSDTLRVMSLPRLPFQPIISRQAEAPAGSILYTKRILMLGRGGISELADRFLPDMNETQQVLFKAQLVNLEGQELIRDNYPDLYTLEPMQDLSIDLYTISDENGIGLHLTQARLKLDSEGMVKANMNLAPGEYWLTADSWLGGEIQQRITIANDEESQTIVIPLLAPAILNLKEAFIDLQGQALSRPLRGSKWIFQPRGSFNHERKRLIKFVLNEAQILMPAGEWKLQVSRGWHFSLYQESLNLSPGQKYELQAELKEELITNGWSAGEFHQHSAPSLDSLIAYKTRIISNIVEGVGFMVPSDHDVMADYPSMVQKFGFNNDIAAPITGLEISPRAGHLGAYGINYNANDESGAGGAPPLSVKRSDGGGEAPDTWRLRTMPELITEARTRGAEIIQVNHPRDSTGYFDTVGFDPNLGTLPLTHEQWTSDFDTIEVFNGAGDLCAVMKDWQSLLLQGKRVTAVGNSDSHSLGRPVGYPRNYLPTSANRAIGVSKAEIIDALKTGKVSIGGGAYLSLGQGLMWGDTLLGRNQSIALQAHSSSFTQLTKLRAYFNGKLIWEQTLNSPIESLSDFSDNVTINVEEDGFLIFFAEGPNLIAVHPSQPTFALSNPLWIDVDEDNEITFPQNFNAPEDIRTNFCP